MLAPAVLVVLTLCHELAAQSPPPVSPCPAVFQYEYDPDQQEWHGVITIVPPTLFTEMTVEIRTTLSFYRKNAGEGGIGLGEDEQQLAAWVFRRERRPVRIIMTFPPYNILPKLAGVNINGKEFCPPIPTPADTVHMITLQYKLKSGSNGPIASGNAYQTVQEFKASKSGPRPPLLRPTLPTAPPLVVDRVMAPEPQCGHAAVKPVPLITNGSPSQKGNWPWHVGMYQVTDGDHKYICGSTLISLGTVVTASHCIFINGKVVDPSTRMLYFGKYTWELFGETTVQQREVSKIIAHPNFSPENYQSDIAIMIPKTPVTFNNFVRPICLWQSTDIDVRAIEGQQGTVVGWGVNEDGERKSELQIAKLPIVSKEQCINSFREFYGTYTNDKSFCAGRGPESDVNVCNGDSGGGMYLPRHNPDESITWQLRGIVSLSPRGTDEKIMCDPRSYSIFTDVAQFLPFIKQYLT